MESTIGLLAEKGVGGATVRAITSNAGVSHGLIRHFYETKDDLLVASLQHLFSVVADDVCHQIEAAGPDPMARLRALPMALFSPSVFTTRNRAAFLALWHDIRFNQPVRDANRGSVGYRKRVQALFAAVIESECAIEDPATSHCPL